MITKSPEIAEIKSIPCRGWTIHFVLLEISVRSYACCQIAVLCLLMGCATTPSTQTAAPPRQANGVYVLADPEMESKTVYWTKSASYGLFEEQQYVQIQYSPSSPFASFTGVTNGFSPQQKPELILGHLIYKNGDEYKGAFFKDNFSGLGRYTQKGKAPVEGVFLEGVLVEQTELAFDFDFALLKTEIAKKTTSTQNGWQLSVLIPLLAQTDGKKLKGWRTNYSSRDGQFTANLDDWDWLYNSVKKSRIPQTPFTAYVANDVHISLVADTYFDTIAQKEKNTLSVHPRFVGCATYLTEGGLVQGRIPSGWHITEHGKVFYKIDSYAHPAGGRIRVDMDLINKLGEINTHYSSPADFPVDSSVPSNTNHALTEILNQGPLDHHYCSPDITAQKIDAYLSFIETEKEKMDKIWAAHSETRAKIAKRQARREQEERRQQRLKAEAAERKRLASMMRCPNCAGRGHIITTQKNETRYTPTHTYRNGLKITSRTSITSNQTRYGGTCGRCQGSGLVPKGQ